ITKQPGFLIYHRLPRANQCLADEFHSIAKMKKALKPRINVLSSRTINRDSLLMRQALANPYL
ncbi:MAG: hypothetical protein VX683_00195, partial [Cyanobacteriota bacterium]|nr:hypothetical protein [Cyanobacteriota bacterium]